MYTISEIIDTIESVVPRSWQESYDNSGIQVGNPLQDCRGIVLAVDFTEEVIQKAIDLNSNLIIAHHPLLFTGVKRITEHTSTERIICIAIRHNIVLYAAHTNLDASPIGINGYAARLLGLQNIKPLSPTTEKLTKGVVFVPESHSESLMNALFEIGVGQIGNYDRCSFLSTGVGSFRPNAQSNPHIGTPSQQEKVIENRIEFIFPSSLNSRVAQTIHTYHPYEVPSFDLIPVESKNPDIGIGIIGTLPTIMDQREFIAHLKCSLKLPENLRIKISKSKTKTIARVAYCGGSGGSLIGLAEQAKADIYITGEVKYHDFFRPNDTTIIAEIGHFESEAHAILVIRDIICKKITNFASLISFANSNPTDYIS